MPGAQRSQHAADGVRNWSAVTHSHLTKPTLSRGVLAFQFEYGGAGWLLAVFLLLPGSGRRPPAPWAAGLPEAS